MPGGVPSSRPQLLLSTFDLRIGESHSKHSSPKNLRVYFVLAALVNSPGPANDKTADLKLVHCTDGRHHAEV